MAYLKITNGVGLVSGVTEPELSYFTFHAELLQGFVNDFNLSNSQAYTKVIPPLTIEVQLEDLLIKNSYRKRLASEFNAFVSKHNKTGVISITVTKGTLWILGDIFTRMLAYNNVLKGIGNPSVEKLSSPSIRSLYLDSDKFNMCADLQYGEVQKAIPVDETRRNFSQFLHTYALMFLFHHEHAHIIQGHLEWLISQAGSKLDYYEENFYQDEDDSYSVHLLTLQTLEMDADCVAINRCINDVILRAKHSQLAQPQLMEFYKDINYAIAYGLAAAYTVLRICASKGYDEEKLEQYRHQTPTYRMIRMLACAETHLKRYFSTLVDVPKAIGLGRQLCREIEDCIYMISAIPSDLTKWPYANYKHNPIGIKLEDHWRTVLLPLLVPFAYKTLDN